MAFLKHLRKPEVRASVQSALVTSTHVPNSGLTFIDNSQGCSAAVAELSGLLDVALDQFDCEKEPSDQLQLQLKRLYNEAENYSNGNLEAENSDIEPWNCSRHDAEIISASFACAAAVYEEDKTPTLPGFSFERAASISANFTGTTKATEIYLVSKSNDENTGSASAPPIVIVAVRGTASTVDRMVNLNGEGKELHLDNLPKLSSNGEPFYAHAGFLNAAEDLDPLVARKLKTIMLHHEIEHVVFTGHSAGGATASLLFAKYISRAVTHYPTLKFSNISFGAPPTTTPNLSHVLSHISPLSKNKGLVLSIVNEYDLVPRADGAYIRSLVDLYRSIYSLPPISDNQLSSQPSEVSLPRFSFEKRAVVAQQEKVRWPLPEPIYWHIGDVVVWRTEIMEFDEEYGDGEGEELVLSALKVERDAFKGLLWCSCAVHKRVRYKERVDLLLGGKFNGRAGW